jgi:hypothetical protein
MIHPMIPIRRLGEPPTRRFNLTQSDLIRVNPTRSDLIRLKPTE